MGLNYNILICDLGGVVIRLNTQFLKLFLVRYGLTLNSFDNLCEYDLFEKGLLAPFDFFSKLKYKYNFSIEYNTFCTIWMDILGSETDGMLKLIQDFKKNHGRVFGLSNTNSIHIPKILFYPSVKEFEWLYASCNIGLRKPDKDIYRYIIKERNLNPKDILFVDDKQKFVDGASAVGINAVKFDGVDNLRKLIFR